MNPGIASLRTQEALSKRYGEDQIPPVGPWNATLDLLLSHRSIRGYRSDPLPTGTLETLIAAAQSAATSSNLQTWSVIAVTDPKRKAVLAQCSNNQKHIEQCPLFLVWCADISRLQRLGEAERVELEVLPFLETFVVAAIDAALAAQNAVVAAESLGLSTVYIGALRNDPKRVAEELAMPAGCMGVFGLCVGYPAPGVANEVKPRLPQAAILHHERYAIGDEAGQRAAYDTKLKGFSSRNEMVHDTWTQRVISRAGKVKALSGRDRLKAMLEALGFGLK